MPRTPKLALIDAHALIHRAYHALPPMTTREGAPTNAVYGFTTMLLKVFSTLKPTHVIAAFDVKGPTFRVKDFAGYKAHRKKADDELIAQFALVKEVLTAFNIPIIEKKGYEADDVIGTIADKMEGKVRTVIVTGDADTLQLVDDDTSVFTLKRGVTDTILYDEQTVREKYGFGPEHIPDYKGLAGDPSDNIPGVAGIGDKTAKELIIRYGTVEEILEKLEEIPEKYRKKLEKGKKDALLSKKLATIHRNVPVAFSLEKALLHEYDSEQVRKVFEKFEFRSLLNRLPEGGTEIQPSLLQKASGKGAVTEQENRTSKEEIVLPKNYHLVETAAEREALKKTMRKAPIMALDTENDSLGAREYPIVGISFALPRRSGAKAGAIQAYYAPVNRESVKDWKDILEDESIAKTGHNLKYDLKVLEQSGIAVRGVVFDSMIASYLLHPAARQHGLDTLAVQELGHHMIPITQLIGKGKDQKRISEVPLLELARYAAEDADIALQLYETLRFQIEEEKLQRVLTELEVPLIEVLADLELAGVRVDVKRLNTMQKSTAKRLISLRKNIWKQAGEEFNVNSTQQLRRILYEKLKLATSAIKRTQSGYSTAASELDKLLGQHPIIEMLVEYRELSKLQNTYIEVLPELVDKTTGRIYGEINQVVAATGRLSSQNPNLQNIPVRTELGQEIRAAFVAERGKVLIKADYSQIELRLAAHMSQDERMIDAFRRGEDIHAATAASVYGVKLKDVKPEQRRRAKTLNFGVLYGMGAQSFARTAKMSVEEARSFIGRYREQYLGLANFIEETISLTHQTEEVATLFGRKRKMPEINSNAPAMRAQAERIAFNFPLQGTAADILKKAMIEVYQYLDKHHPEAHIVLTVHDELVIEAPEDEAKKLARAIKKIMEGVYVLDVPLIVDVAIGKNWRDVEEVK